MAENEQQTMEQMAQILMKTMGQVNAYAAPQPAVMPAPAQAVFAPQAPTMQGIPNPTGWSVPVEADINGMTVTVYVQFAPQSFPQYQQIIAAMMNMGYQVRAFARNGGGYASGNGGSWGGRGGYGGGYNRGGYGRKW